MVKRLTIVFAALLVAVGVEAQPASILQYIRNTWGVLTRSNHTLAAAAVDPKFHPSPDGRWPVYIASSEDAARIRQQLSGEMSESDFRKIDVRQLPADPTQLSAHGLLYLPEPYVVPGGRFNEMYGWDSYFIQLGLLRDGLVPLARNMADNFLYEIRNYGMILNANRTYYMTRSQPPFLTEMLLGVFKRTHDRLWLEQAMPEVEKYYRYWTSAPHLTPETGLSRYFDSGKGPAPEVVASERDAQGRSHYDLVQQYFRTHQVTAYDASQYYDARQDRLTMLFYTGDRSMRESGFDPSDRFGPFSVDIIHYDPVCLNSLLYVMEQQTAEILRALGRTADVSKWEARARDRAAKVNSLMWDSHDGLYYDYDIVHQRVRRYPFLTTFYPLWAGIASREQAVRVAANLKLFERAGGLETSTNESGNQWDAPFGWAPLELIAVEGLRRYGYTREADRISREFLSLILDQYRRSGAIVEKYDVVRRSMEMGGHIRFGYRSNEAGFGWTNAAFTALLDEMPPAEREELLPRQ
jgi:alpha,alpha-trehalase